MGTSFPVLSSPKRKARPERLRVSIRNETNGIFLFRRKQRALAAGLIIGAFFAVFAAIAWIQFGNISLNIRDISDLTGTLFQVFWLMGWSVGVVILGGLTLLLLLAGDEMGRIYGGRLILQSRLGFIWIISEYDISNIRNLSYKNDKIYFNYKNGREDMGGKELSPQEAERIIAKIKQAAGADLQMLEAPEEPAVPKPELPPAPVIPPSQEPIGWTSPSAISLIIANLIPLGGVIFLGWNLGEIMLLFWAESAIVGFYNIIKLIIVGQLAAIFTVPFFIGHYGGFMSVHFMFVYYMFIHSGQGSESAAGIYAVLSNLFEPLLPALLLLFISHGISLWTNFIGNKEYAGRQTSQQMQEPYMRIFIMQATIIFGGWMVMLLGSPLPALMLLIALKIVFDMHAHQKEHNKAVTKPLIPDKR